MTVAEESKEFVSAFVLDLYRKRAKAAINRPTKAPVAISGRKASLLLEELAVALAEDEAVVEAAEADEDEAAAVELDAAADDEVLELELEESVAFLVPHCSLAVQVAWPSASLGLAAIHWMKVCWQM